jgi:polysaccharide biosynthesis protein PelG
MIDAVRSGLANICGVQIVVIGTLLLLAPELVSFAGFAPDRVALFRIDVLAATSQFLMLTTLLLVLYLDARRTALGIAALFVTCNLVGTQLTIISGRHLDGVGYLIAGTVGATVALLALWSRLRRLEYLTFMLQPMASGQ